MILFLKAGKISHKSHNFPQTVTLRKEYHVASNASRLFLFKIDEETMADRGDAPWPAANGQEGRKHRLTPHSWD